jgi:glucose-6-phosphate isomerase
MENMKLSIEKAFGFVSPEKVAGYKADVKNANEALHNGTGKGNDFLGWLHLPSETNDAFLSEIEDTAKILRENCEAVVVIGIGGSYLGAKAVIDALSNSFDWLQKERKNPIILYA